MRQPLLNHALVCFFLLSLAILNASVASGNTLSSSSCVSDTLIAPPDVTVSCTDFDPTLTTYGTADASGISCLDTLTAETNYTLFDELCYEGVITRTYTAYDCGGFIHIAVQHISVTYEQYYFIKFPNDVIATNCTGYPLSFGEPTFFGEDCELMAVSYEDEIFGLDPTSCYKIERNWTVINWCTYDPGLPCVYVPNPTPSAIVNHPSNLPGPIVSAPGTAAPWAPTIVKATPTDTAATNYSIFWNANANCYRYKQIIKILDTADPLYSACPVNNQTLCDDSENDENLWSGPSFWDASAGLHDLGEGEVDLNITVTDSCSGPNVSVSYILFLDIDADGVMETQINSNMAQTPGVIPYLGGTQFDKRPVADSLKYRFTVHQELIGNSRKASVRWDWLKQPVIIWNSNQGVKPHLPYGNHKIKWITEDGCGNAAVCEYTFTVKDCKKPTVVCINGLSASVLPNGNITLWTSDFLQYAEDNHTPVSALKFGIQKSLGSTGAFPVDAQGNPISSLTFNCDDLGTQLVQIWAKDAAGNADFCETYVIIQDLSGHCDTISNGIDLCIHACNNPDKPIGEVSIQLDGSNPGLPPISLFDYIDGCGSLLIDNWPLSTPLTLTPYKDENPLNGVTTYDIILISEHILGDAPFSNGCQWLAADANRSNSVTVFDIIELRRLILGIYSELPNNSSWRFIYGSGTIPSYPFGQPLSGSVTLNGPVDTTVIFQSVKIGDLNGSAIGDNLTGDLPSTLESQYLLLPDVSLAAGAEIKIPVATVHDINWLGYQFAMQYDPELVQIVDIIPGENMTLDNFGLFQDAITVSWSGDGNYSTPAGAQLFEVKVKVLQNTNVANVLTLLPQRLMPEVYTHTLDRHPLQLLYGPTPKPGNAVFSATAPWPNPTHEGVHWMVYAPESAPALVQIFDQNGKRVWMLERELEPGWQLIEAPVDALPANMLYHWQIRFDGAGGAGTQSGSIVRQ